MAEPFDTDRASRLGAGAARATDELNARFQTRRGDGKAESSGRSPSRDPAGAPGGASASQAAEEAKGLAGSIAEQARARVAEIIDEQKAAGAAQIAGVARAAHSAAGELDATNPQMARLVRTAAESVERVAADVRSSDVATVFQTLADVGRRQPVAFFGGAVLAGFLLSRFLKSDAPLVDATSLHRESHPL